MKQATAKTAANWLRLYAMPLASAYPSYIAKAEKKGRTRARSTRSSAGSPVTVKTRWNPSWRKRQASRTSSHRRRE